MLWISVGQCNLFDPRRKELDECCSAGSESILCGVYQIHKGWWSQCKLCSLCVSLSVLYNINGLNVYSVFNNILFVSQILHGYVIFIGTSYMENEGPREEATGDKGEARRR